MKTFSWNNCLCTSITVVWLGFHDEEGQLSDCEWTCTSGPVAGWSAGTWTGVSGMILLTANWYPLFASQESPAFAAHRTCTARSLWDLCAVSSPVLTSASMGTCYALTAPPRPWCVSQGCGDSQWRSEEYIFLHFDQPETAKILAASFF